MTSKPIAEPPRFEPFNDVVDEDVLRLKDFERLIYDNPGWLLGVLDGQVSPDEVAPGVSEDIDFVTGKGAEVFVFDDATEDYINADLGLQYLLIWRASPKTSPEQQQPIRDLIRKQRLRLFVQRVAVLHATDDSHKIKPFPQVSRVVKSFDRSNKKRGNGGGNAA